MQKESLKQSQCLPKLVSLLIELGHQESEILDALTAAVKVNDHPKVWELAATLTTHRNAKGAVAQNCVADSR